jgi:hypothetical protein
VSKENQNKKQNNQESSQNIEDRRNPSSKSQIKLRKLGAKPVRRKTNTRFFVLLAIWVVALIIGLLFISGKL